MDYKNDCYKYDHRIQPDRDIVSTLSQYNLRLVHEYCLGYTYLLGEEAGDDWYHGKISWLCRLVRALGIQMDKIADSMRRMVEERGVWLEMDCGEKLEMEKGIGHFLGRLRNANIDGNQAEYS